MALSPWGSPFVQHVCQHFDAFTSVPSYIHSGILDAYIQDAAYHPLDTQVLDSLKVPWMGETGQPAFYRQIAQMDQKYTDELESLFGDMRCPVDIQEDTWITVEKGHQLQKAIPNSTLTRISEAAHLVQEDQPRRLLEALMTLTT